MAEAGRTERLEELQELVARTEGIDADSEDRLHAERERLRHVTELAEAATSAAEALAPEFADANGAAELTGRAAAALLPAAPLAPELAQIQSELADGEIRLREAVSSLRAFLTSLEADPGRLEQVEGQLERIADARRRFDAATTEELLSRALAARSELESVAAGVDPVAAAERALAEVDTRVAELSAAVSEARVDSASSFSEAVAEELKGLGMGDGEFRVELPAREPGPSGREEAIFLIRPNSGLPFAPVAETASGGELSRIALALRAVAHAGAGEPTIVFDEIDAGIGGRTGHAVADALGRLGDRAQIVTITHLPQIASVAEAHFRVEKVPGDPTHTRIERLSESERREEVERMLGGAEFLAGVRESS